MNLDFTVEQQELRAQARRLMESRRPVAAVRQALEGAPGDDGLWREVADLGWFATAIPEEHGGLGLSRVFLCGLAEECGRALAPLALESSVFAAAEALLI